MKKLTLALLLLSCTINAQMPNVANDNKWNLVFEDEFEGDIINTNWWEAPDFIFNDPNCVFINTKLAYKNEGLPNDNVIVDNGILTLTVDKLTTPINRNIHCFNGINWPNFYADITYTSGRLLSTQEFQYGYFEIKFKLPGEISGPNTNRPFGANFWLTESSQSVSCYSELDIFEIVDGETNYYTCNSHNSPIGSPFCGGMPEYTDDGSIYGGGFGSTNISANEWHISSAHWSPEKIDYYLDGKLIKTNFKSWVENLDPMKIILDINAPKFDYGALISLDDFSVEYPYHYDIEYVKVYQLVDDGCSVDNKYYCGTEPPSTDGDIILKSAVFGGSGCGGSNFTHMDNSLYANDYILIDENTILGGGTGTIYLDVNKCYNP